MIARVKLVAESFAWPFRAPAATWVLGIVAVLLVPILFIPLLGYAVAATRAAEDGASAPPRWDFSLRLLADGFWTALAILLTMLPFALALNPLAAALGAAMLREPYAHVVAFFGLALLWGLVALLLLPHATSAFATTGAPRDLFDVRQALRGVGRDFATWNVAAAAMVTAWAIGLVCAGVFCVGLVPGAFYAILVSAHAAAALHRPDSAGPGAPAR